MTHEFLPVQRIGPFTLGEIPLTLSVTFEDSAGNAINLTDYNAETVIEGVDDTEDLAPSGETVIADVINGIVEYRWGESDFMTEGQYRAQIWVAKDTVERKQLASDIFEWFVRFGTSAPTGL